MTPREAVDSARKLVQMVRTGERGWSVRGDQWTWLDRNWQASLSYRDACRIRRNLVVSIALRSLGVDADEASVHHVSAGESLVDVVRRVRNKQDLRG